MKTTQATKSHGTFSDLVSDSGLDFAPEHQAMFLANGAMVDGSNAVVRPDTGDILGVVGRKATIVPYTEVSAILDAKGEDGVSLSDLVRPTLSLSFGNGASVALTGPIVGGDTEIVTGRGSVQVAAHLTATSSLDGSFALRIIPSGHCVVCLNTLSLAMRKDVWGMRAKHTAGGKVKFAGFAERVKKTIAVFRNRSEAWQKMANTKVSGPEALEYFEKVFSLATSPRVETWSVSDILDETEGKAGKPGKVLESLLDAYENAPGADPGTVWGLYQAATYRLSNVVGRSDGARARSLISGPSAQIVEIAEAEALRMIG